MVAFEQPQNNQDLPKNIPANDKLTFAALMHDKNSAAPTDSGKKPATLDANETTKQQTAELSALLSPHLTDFRTKDNRTADQVAQSHKDAINKPLTHDDFLKAQNILNKPGLSDDATRSAIAEKLNLPPTAKDADIRQKIADNEQVKSLFKELKFEPMPTLEKHLLKPEDFKLPEKLPNTRIESHLSGKILNHRGENDTKSEVMGTALMPGLGQTKDNRKWDDIIKADQRPYDEGDLRRARTVLNKPDLSDSDTKKAIAESVGLPSNAEAGDVRAKIRFDEQMRKMLKQNYDLRPEP